MKKRTTKRDTSIYRDQARRIASNKKGLIYKGFSIEAEEKEGQSIEGNSIWLQDKNGDFYWSGDFEKEEEDVRFNRLIDYRNMIDLREPLSPGQGRNVLVAVLDTGIRDHPDLRDAVVFSKSFVEGQDIGHDTSGHGTSMAGLIRGNPEGEFGVRGLAPRCEIMDLKVMKDDGGEDTTAIRKALEFIAEGTPLKPDIVNMSLSVSDYDAIKSALDRVTDMGIYVVVAGGEENVFHHGKTSLLAKHPKVISAGAVRREYMEQASPRFPSGLGFFFHNARQWSASLAPQHYRQEFGDSVYTALVSGLLAAEISSSPAANHPDILRRKAFSPSEFNSQTLKLYRP